MLHVTPLTPTIGAEIAGADLTRPLGAGAFATIRQAVLDHCVVFFRDQPALSPDEQVRVARNFGDLHTHPAAPTLVGYPEIFVIHTHGGSLTNNGGGWHSDVSCDEEPPSLTMLQIQELPAVGGDTLWSSTAAAFDALSDAVQDFVVGLTARHESEHVYRGRYADRGVDDTGRSYPSARHPVVRLHPESGRRCLYVNRAFTTRIDDLGPLESERLLGLLFDHVEQPRFQVRFTWTRNAIALWDNRSTQHLALWDYWPHERRGHRVTVAGERPIPARAGDAVAVST